MMETVVVSNATGEKSLWEKLMTDWADPRTEHLFLISSPIYVIAIVASYLYFVLVCGKNFMKNRKPYSLKRTLMIYNLFQIAANLYLFREAVLVWRTYNWNCEPLDRSTSPAAISIAFHCYLYFLNKISDLMDTVFFVLRKKNNQITFLHLFHHSFMPIGTWIAVKYLPGGHATFVGLLNTFVHVLLYAYYYLAAFGPAVQKYLWWKKYLTRIQLIQFCLVFIHQIQLLYFDCGFPKWSVFLTLPNALFFYYLFNDFYHKSYTAPETSQQNGKVKNE